MDSVADDYSVRQRCRKVVPTPVTCGLHSIDRAWTFQSKISTCDIFVKLPKKTGNANVKKRRSRCALSN
ncbi:hypothetical protein DPMN_131203 [Dreissena polymorpha]|uniref:Uncharacterized protein n=1 Tax=Dreissena polymorpha TaxID=45954 RepID=A0A9D4H650_DREPO|nr:hypothetical protein DPMN_131203 [Dreissena polymorpha]